MLRRLFIGDVNQTYEAYHRFSGIANAPPPCRIKKGIILEPIACHGNKKKKSEKEKSREVESNISERTMPKLIPINADLPMRENVREMPKLIPIQGHYPHGKNHHDKKHKDDDDMKAAIGSSLYDAIGEEEEEVDAALQHTEADFVHLPDVNDVFK